MLCCPFKRGVYVMLSRCAQVLLPLLTSDLYEVMLSCVKGRLPSCTPLRFHDDLVAVGVVAATAGYPGKYKKDIPIKGERYMFF